LSRLPTQKILQITDVHLRAGEGSTLLGVDTWDTLLAVLEQALSEASPDALLVTGDVAHDPQPEVYARFDALLGERLSCPRMVLPGNHDVLGHMVRGPESEQLSLPGWTIVALDSHVDEQVGAEVDAAEFERLKESCAAAEGDHLLVATHHPPVPVGCPWLDKDRIKIGPELLEWLSEHSRVRAMVFGHAHQRFEASHRHISLLGTPATCFQFAPGSASFAVNDERPGYRWLELGSDGEVCSTVRRVDDYPLALDLGQLKQE